MTVRDEHASLDGAPLLDGLLSAVHEGVLTVEADGTIARWGGGAERITGYATAEMVGRLCHEHALRHLDADGRELTTSACPIDGVLKTGRPFRALAYILHKDGYRVPVHVAVEPLCDSDGTVTGAVETFAEDYRSAAAAELIAHLRDMAMLDPLTGIGNRRYARMALSARLNESARYGVQWGCLFLDLDHFKRVNDAHGHEVGDRVLQTAAATLRNSLRPSDLLTRWGGEEFVAIVSHVDAEGLLGVAERARRLLEQSQVDVEDVTVRATISIGATMARPDDSVDCIVRRADQLMYASKQDGRNRVTTDGPTHG